MANISTYINALRNAVYGEDVRSALISAITAINNIAQVASDQGFCFRGSLTSADNLNNAVSPGVYKWTTGAEPINGPGNSSTAIMFVVCYSGQLCYQIIYSNSNGRLYYRNRLSSGTWSSWDKFLFNSEFTSNGFCFRGELASTDNLNNAVSPGVYKWTTGAEPINGPGSVNTSIMFVVSYSGQLCFQIVFNNNSGKLYYRNRLSSGTWSSWDTFFFSSEFVLPKIITPELLNLTDVEITYFDKYIDCSGDTVDLTTREDSSTYHCMVKACVPGDRFYINSTGGTTKSRTFCFIDSSNNILYRGNNGVEIKTVTVAPANSAYVVMHITKAEYNAGVRFYYNSDLISTASANSLIKEIPVFGWTSSKAISSSDGTLVASNLYKASDRIYLNYNNGDYIFCTLPRKTLSGGSRPSFGFGFYDNTDTCLGTIRMNKHNSLGNPTVEMVCEKIPQNTYYARTTWYGDSSEGTYDDLYDGFHVGVVPGGLTKSIVNKFAKIKHYPLLGSPQIRTLTLSDTFSFTPTVTNINNFFDDLVTNYPEIIHREADLGYDASNTYILRHYTIHQQNCAVYNSRGDATISDPTKNLYDETDNDYNYKRILIGIGIHAEKASMIGSIAAINDIVTSTEQWAEFIKTNFILDIVPCINPWGLENNSNSNYNDVNLNRDFVEFTQAESQHMKALIDDLCTKGLCGIIDNHNSTVGGCGYWVTKTTYKYYKDYIGMAQKIGYIVNPLFKEIYANTETPNPFNGTWFFVWNYDTDTNNGQMHEYGDKLGLLVVSTEVRSDIPNNHNRVITRVMLPNIINLFGTFER